MNPDIKRHLVQHKSLIVTTLLLVLALSGVLHTAVDIASRPISRENDEYLNKSIESTVHLMMPIGVVKGAADVIEGSSAVVEWGDIVQPILDYLDVAWRVLILSLIVSTAVKFTLLGIGSLANAFLVFALLAYLASCMLHKTATAKAPIVAAAKRLAGLFILVYLLLIAILPLTIYGTSQLSAAITEPLQAETFASFEKAGEVFSLDAITKQDGFLDKVDAIKKKAVDVIRYSGSATADIAGSVARLTVIKVLDGIVFPLLCLAFLVWLVRGVLYPLLGLSEGSLARDDLRHIGDLLTRNSQPEKKTPKVEQSASLVREARSGPRAGEP